MDEKKQKNRKVTRKVIMGSKGAFVSEIVEFDEPENYENAFKQYYPNDKEV